MKPKSTFCEFTIGGLPMISSRTQSRKSTIRKRHPTKGPRYAATEYLVGPSPKGPNRCLQCGQPFKAGEPWQRRISPPDPELGSYAIGIHSRCLNK